MPKCRTVLRTTMLLDGSVMMMFHAVFLYLVSQSCALFCPPVEFPCTCASSTFEPVSIRCTGANSFSQILQALTPAKVTLRIDSLIVNATPVATLPAKAFQGLNIGRLSIRKAGLIDISPEAFDGPLLESISELDFTDNSLTQIPINGVAMLKNLKKLILSKNQIPSLNKNSFSQYESKERIKCLDLSFNRIGILDPEGIVQLKNLEELDLRGNLLTNVPSEALNQIRSTLKHLNLAINKISRIDIFDLPNLESLSMEYNSLTELKAESFQGLPSLHSLYLTGNKLSKWEPEVFRNVCALRNLGMGGNAITEIPENAFIHLPRLLRLEMSKGLVSKIDTGAFRLTPCIQAIVLNNNNITEVKNEAFRGLRKLYTLDLSQNDIQNVEEGAFSSLPKLTHLDLSGNEMRMLDSRMFENTFKSSNGTKVLYLCRNPWLCNESMDNFRRWLRENIEIVIDKPDCAAVCKEPGWLTNWPIRFPNPPPPSSTEYRYSQSGVDIGMKTTVTVPPVLIGISATTNASVSSSSSSSSSISIAITASHFMPPYLNRTWHTMAPIAPRTISSQQTSSSTNEWNMPKELIPTMQTTSSPGRGEAPEQNRIGRITSSTFGRENDYHHVKSILESRS